MSKKKIDTGGDAFPLNDGIHVREGMTLLDLFASQALPECIRYVDGFGGDDYEKYRKANKTRGLLTPEDFIAHLAYEQAQAMVRRKRELEQS